MSEERCPELPWPLDEPRRRRAHLGAYIAVFFVEETAAGAIAVVEFVRHRRGVEPWLEKLEELAKAEEARLAKEKKDKEADEHVEP